jgi:putative flippase GtrA
LTRLVRFNVVGAMGFALQLGVLFLLERAGWPVLLATLTAVEAAVLHNFVWHERWTWADVRAGTRTARLARFHVSNGLISLVGNTVLTTGLVAASVPLVGANVLAVIVCAGANFAAAHAFVFCATTWPTFHGHLQ